MHEPLEWVFENGTYTLDAGLWTIHIDNPTRHEFWIEGKEYLSWYAYLGNSQGSLASGQSITVEQAKKDSTTFLKHWLDLFTNSIGCMPNA